ncbi:MAG: sulfotransferase [Xanthomonadales bacterium]|nr:sulfotransferase [Xanthomonadales bacterium]
MQNDQLRQLSQAARVAAQRRDWVSVAAFANKIQKLDKKEPEAYFLAGLAEKGKGQVKRAIQAFIKTLSLNSQRYDAAIELADLYLLSQRHSDSFGLLERYQQSLTNSPLYLDMAARVFSALGLHNRAWPLFQQANLLQPGVDMFRANLAACSVLLGKVNDAKALYRQLLEKYPQHQKNHYELSKLETTNDSAHLEQMQTVLKQTQLPAEKNIFLYYAIGKELEDLERWQESFHYYKLAGDAVAKVADYDVADDIAVIEKIIKVCNADWLVNNAGLRASDKSTKTPIFIVGLPRTGTTLTERIISSHSQVESADETFFMQLAIRHAAGVGGIGDVNELIIEKAARKNIRQIAQKYMQEVTYRLTDRPLFIDKYPYNFLYLGFIAKAFPKARIVYLRRNPMDACFAMYKQSFFKFAYSLDNLGQYFVAQDRLRRHWQSVLGDRLIEVEYESLVSDQENQTRLLLDKLGLEFEPACLSFEKNPTASASASTLQVREKMHSRSVNKWKYFAAELQPLKEYLRAAGIGIN